MGKNLRNFLALIFATFGLVLLMFSSQSTNVQAATNYNTNSLENGLLSGMKIEQKDYGTASNVHMTLDWDATGKDLANGDIWTISLPEQVKVVTPSTFDLKDDTGRVVGKGTVNADNTITITFTDLPDDKTDYKGTIDLTNGITPSSKADIGKNNVTLGNYSDNMTVVTSDADFSKKGVLGTDENGDSIITWTILVNRNSGDFPNLKVSDYIDSTVTPGQTYIPGSVNVYEASWSSPGYYKKDRLLSSSEYTLNESDNGFELTGLKNNQFYAITLQTKVTDQDNASDGSKFRNKALYQWGNGSGSGNYQGDVNASVTGNANTGSGNGSDYNGTVTLTKTSTASTTENQIFVEGAVYDLYKVGTKDPIQTGLTTDSNGQITVGSLAAGDYYFKEVTAAPNYHLNDLEIPFQIDSKGKVVNVTTQDTPSTKDYLGSIAVMKIDNETGYRLVGAEFEILNQAGDVVGTFTTDGNGIGNYYDLPLGKYTLRETKAPEGYILSEKDYQFEITIDNLTPAMIFFENEKEEVFDDSYFVNLQKFDRANMSVGVADAEYTLYDSEGNAIETKTTDKNGLITIDGLKPGSYYFQETKAPDDYDINDDKIHFEIVSGSTSTETLVTSDPKKTTGGGSGGGGSTEEPDTDTDDNDGEDDNNGSTEEPGDNNGNEGNTENPDTDGNGNNGNEEDNNGGVIVDPENPGSNNNNGNSDGGIITNPINPGNSNNGSNSNNSGSTLPQTGEKSSLIVSLLGLIVLTGLVYFRRRKA